VTAERELQKPGISTTGTSEEDVLDRLPVITQGPAEVPVPPSMRALTEEMTAEQARVLARGKRRVAKPVTLIYVPLHLGGSHRGVSMGPAAMKVAEVQERLEHLGFKVVREVNVNVPPSVCWWDKQSGSKCVPEIAEVSQEVAAAVEGALANDTIPITIGGDHSLAIGSIAGAANYYRKCEQTYGLIWFDAHGDINTPETTHSGNVHGMPFAVSLGHGDPRLVDMLGFSPKAPARRSVLVGIRDVDEPEREIIN
jgi:arginase